MVPYGCCKILVIIRSEIEHIFSALFEVVDANFSEVDNYAKSGPSRAV